MATDEVEKLAVTEERRILGVFLRDHIGHQLLHISDMKGVVMAQEKVESMGGTRRLPR